jgi:putative nucleotidyltransferase with HDIG domain
VSPLQGGSIAEDLRRRDFTVNAMGLPLAGGPLVDPLGGSTDLAAGVLRVLGGPDVERSAYATDVLRPLRLARLATELSLSPDPGTARLTRAAAARVTGASPERIWAELRRLVGASRVVDGLQLAADLGLLAWVLPEVDRLRGVEQSTFHHRDVFGHTLEAMERLIELEGDLPAVFGAHAPELRRVLSERLDGELTRGEALRFATLLHDVGKPATLGLRSDGRGYSFIGHDRVGAEIVSRACRRLRTSERLRMLATACTRHHLVLGFLVHERPLSRRTIYRYLTTCEPAEVEVTLLTCADRLATRGANADAAITAHLDLARELMGEALRWRAGGAPRVPVRGDDVARETGLERGPELGRVLELLREASFAGEISSPEDAFDLARRLRENPGT